MAAPTPEVGAARLMPAARAHARARHLEVEEVPVPEVGTGEVLVQVRSAGLTHNLLQLWRVWHRVKLLPSTLGHEMAGVVAETGPGVTGFKRGERVRVHPILSCRACYYCRTGQEALCGAVCLIGHSVYSDAGMPLYERYHDGGLAPYVRAPAWALDRLPDEVSFDAAAKLHDLAVAFRALKRARPAPGGTLVLTGASGALGSAVVSCAPVLGITLVVAVARRRQGLERLRALAPDIVQPLAIEDLPPEWAERRLLGDTVRELVGDVPVSMVDFLPGGHEVTEQCIGALPKASRVTLAGGDWSEVRLPNGLMMLNNLEVGGSIGYRREDAEQLLELLRAERIDVAPLITHRVKLEDVNQLVDAFDGDGERPLFAIVDPRAR